MKPLENRMAGRPVELDPAGPATFLVHIWFEPETDGGRAGEWRGRVTDVVSERTVYFRTLARLKEVVLRLLDEAAASRSLT